MAADPNRDPQNEHALAYLACTNFLAYRALGIARDDFAWPLCRMVVEMAETVFHERGQLPPSQHALEVANRLRDQHRMDHGEFDELFALVMDPPLGVLPDAAKLKRQSRCRRAIDAAQLAIRELRQGNEEVALATLSEAREWAARRLSEQVQVQSPRDLVRSWREEMMRLQENSGISPGLPKLKSVIGQLSAGMVLVVGGATNVGKSSFVLEMVLAAARDGTKAGLVSVEDTTFTTTTRLMSVLSGVQARDLHLGRHVDRAEAACAAIEEYEGGFFIAEAIGGTEQDVCSYMTRMAQEGVRLVVVDYIGEIEASVRQQDRRNDIRWIMKRLKAHALRLGVALVIVSQLARPKDRETGHKPTKHDLKEAGDLENSAEFVVLLWREEEHDFAPVKVELAKSKIGGTGSKWLMQREVSTTDRYGQRHPGSARLREVVVDQQHPADRGFPLLVTDYVAQLALLARG